MFRYAQPETIISELSRAGVQMVWFERKWKSFNRTSDRFLSGMVAPAGDRPEAIQKLMGYLGDHLERVQGQGMNPMERGLFADEVGVNHAFEHTRVFDEQNIPPLRGPVSVIESIRGHEDPALGGLDTIHNFSFRIEMPTGPRTLLIGYLDGPEGFRVPPEALRADTPERVAVESPDERRAELLVAGRLWVHNWYFNAPPLSLSAPLQGRVDTYVTEKEDARQKALFAESERGRARDEAAQARLAREARKAKELEAAESAAYENAVQTQVPAVIELLRGKISAFVTDNAANGEIATHLASLQKVLTRNLLARAETPPMVDLEVTRSTLIDVLGERGTIPDDRMLAVRETAVELVEFTGERSTHYTGPGEYTRSIDVSSPFSVITNSQSRTVAALLDALVRLGPTGLVVSEEDQLGSDTIDFRGKSGTLRWVVPVPGDPTERIENRTGRWRATAPADFIWYDKDAGLLVPSLNSGVSSELHVTVQSADRAAREEIQTLGGPDSVADAL